MPRWQNIVFPTIILALLVGGPWYYASWRHNTYRNLHVVRDGVLYRSGQMTLNGLKRTLHDNGIKTVVTLRFPDDPNGVPPDIAEEKWCTDNNVRYFRLRGKKWTSETGEPPIEENIKKFNEVMSNPDNYPVLVHCFAGIHRTGAYCAVYRMEFEGWSREREIGEMVDHGYTILDDHTDVRKYLSSYQPRGNKLGTPGHIPGVLPVRYQEIKSK